MKQESLAELEVYKDAADLQDVDGVDEDEYREVLQEQEQLQL